MDVSLFDVFVYAQAQKKHLPRDWTRDRRKGVFFIPSADPRQGIRSKAQPLTRPGTGK